MTGEGNSGNEVKMTGYTDEKLISRYMREEGRPLFTEPICFGMEHGFGFRRNARTGGFSPFRGNGAACFFSRLAFPVRVLCITKNHAYVIKRLRDYIDHKSLPLLLCGGEYFIIREAGRVELVLEDCRGTPLALAVRELLDRGKKCEVLLVDGCVSRDFIDEDDFRLILRNTILIDARDYVNQRDMDAFIREGGRLAGFGGDQSFCGARARYADFLDEASDWLGRPLCETAAECREAAGLWKRLGENPGWELARRIEEKETDICGRLIRLLDVSKEK